MRCVRTSHRYIVLQIAGVSRMCASSPHKLFFLNRYEHSWQHLSIRNSNHISILCFLVELDVCCYFDHTPCQVFEMIFARITLQLNNSAHLSCDDQERISSQYSIVATYLSPRSYPSASCMPDAKTSHNSHVVSDPLLLFTSQYHAHTHTQHTLRQC